MAKGKRTRWIQSPQQGRSRATLDRLLDVTEAMLESVNFDDLPIVELVKKSRSSIGAFYSRFSDKEALLDALYERHQQQAVGTFEELFEPKRWSGVALPKVIAEWIRFAVEFHRERRGLLRTLVLRGYAKPDPAYADVGRRARLCVARAGDFIVHRKAEVGHPEPRLAGSLGLVMVLGALRERTLFPASTSSVVKTTEAKLASELTRAYLAYLEVRPTRGRSAPRS